MPVPVVPAPPPAENDDAEPAEGAEGEGAVAADAERHDRAHDGIEIERCVHGRLRPEAQRAPEGF